MNVDEFIALNVDKDRHLELIDGEVFVKPRTTNRHSDMVSNLSYALTHNAKAAGLRVTTHTSAVRTGPMDIRYPDLVVAGGPADPSAWIVAEPLVLIEVEEMPVGYLHRIGDYLKSLPTVRNVLRVRCDAVKVHIWSRIDNGWHAEFFDSFDDRIELPAANGFLKLSDVYSDMDIA